MPTITLPNEWKPRSYQMPLWRYMERGGKRAAEVWHRRAGKDSVALNWAAVAAHQRIGTYWHMLPTLQQGRRVIWDGIDKHGRRMIDQAFPKSIRAGRNDGKNEAEMKISLKCGSVWQVVGSDNYDSLVGSNPVGVTFSEFSVADPKAWDYIRPILAENGGWAIFIYTPRGRNHGFRLYDSAGRANWFREILSVDDTHAIPLSVLEDERLSGMPEDMIQQEYYCSFEAAMAGSYYGKLIEQARREGRICRVPYDSTIPVTTAWDLGILEPTAIWFLQINRAEVRTIDYHEEAGVGLDTYAKLLKDKGYIYGQHIGPHDLAVREIGTGRSRVEIAQSLGINFQVARQLPIQDGINATMQLLPRMWFDESRCELGLDRLIGYHSEYDDKKNDYKPVPVHDFCSHGADALRSYAVSTRLVRASSYLTKDRYARSGPRSKKQQTERNWKTR